MGKLFQELKRRNVIRVAVAYAIVAWLLIQVSATTFPMLRLPEWTATFVMVLLMIGFPVVLIFAWAFELTPEGLKKEKDVDRSQSITRVTGRNLDFVIIGVLIAALGYFAYDKFVLERAPDADLLQATTEAKIGREGELGESETPDKSIAVLPFVNMSADPDNEYFSDGLSEELLNLLAKVPELKVAARTSPFAFKGTNVDATEIARQLRVAHVLEGSVRQSGDRLRITAQLVDASHGYHLWSETWERQLTDIFAIQDEIAASVVESLRIELLEELPRAQRTKPEALSLLLRSRAPARRSTKDGFEEASRLLLQALAIDPEYAAAWGELAVNQTNQAIFGLVEPEQGFAHAEVLAHRALSLDSENSLAMVSLGAIELLWNWDIESAGRWLVTARDVAPGAPGHLIHLRT